MTAIEQHPVSALAVGAFERDRQLLRNVFTESGWQLFEAQDRRRAIQCLEHNRVDIVVAESDVPNWNWKRVLADLRRLAAPPQLIVTSRTADDYLWAEVLNLGGYDVLPQPLERDELERVIAAAHRRHNFRPARAVAGARAAAPIVA